MHCIRIQYVYQKFLAQSRMTANTWFSAPWLLILLYFLFSKSKYTFKLFYAKRMSEPNFFCAVSNASNTQHLPFKNDQQNRIVTTTIKEIKSNKSEKEKKGNEKEKNEARCKITSTNHFVRIYFLTIHAHTHSLDKPHSVCFDLTYVLLSIFFLFYFPQAIALASCSFLQLIHLYVCFLDKIVAI